MQDEIMQYLCEKRDDIKPEYLIATTPPSVQSRFVRVSLDDPFLQKFADMHQ